MNLEVAPEDFEEYSPEVGISETQDAYGLVSHTDQIEKIQQYAHEKLVRLNPKLGCRFRH